MDKQRIITDVESIVNHERDAIEYEEYNKEDPVEVMLHNVVVRLVNVVDRYRNKEAGIGDYLSALRSFMLSFQTEIRIDDDGALSDNSLGIYYNSSTKKYYATYNIPDFVRNKSFVESAFINSNTEKPQMNSPYSLLTNNFIYELTNHRFSKFRSMEQKLCVHAALKTPVSYTTLICMPTGGGKSLITQTLAYEKKGLSIVVVPTVSLAIDQKRVADNIIKPLKDNEIFCYHATSNNIAKITEAIKDQTAKLLFISPEALVKNDTFKSVISQANAVGYLRNIIVDEAHIVVAWGDFFRVDYQCLAPWRRELLKGNPNIRTFLLSATYNDDTVGILKRLMSDNGRWIEVRCDSLRKEPRFIFIKALNESDKRRKVVELINSMPKPLILYVNAPEDAEYWKRVVAKNGYNNIRTFTGNTTSNDRKTIIDQWTENQFEIMIATRAFGVGVDKPDVRSVIHIYVPESPDVYYQELGRGGRDGLNCLSIMCVTDEDVERAQDHISTVLSEEKLWGRWWSMYSNPANMWSGGEISVFASTKPVYSRTHVFEKGNGADEKWNINVLLLLSRYNLIRIVSIDLDDQNRYQFTIRILNEQIATDTKETHVLFEKIRNSESERLYASYNLIKKAIKNSTRECWSSMFYETYPLVSEYCPGCNAHISIVSDELNRFPLLQVIKAPLKEVSPEMKDFFSSTREAVLITDGNRKDIIDYYKPNVIVVSHADRYSEESSPQLIYVNYRELKDLREYDNGYYLSGLIMAIYSSNPLEAAKEYHILKKCVNKDNYILHVAYSDFKVSTISEKKISLDVDGRVLG